MKARNENLTSNILFNLESEKVSDSAVFTTESGTASKVVNSLAPGESTEVLQLDFLTDRWEILR